MSKSKAPKKPGRPPVYTGNVKNHIVSLIRKHGLTGAATRLNANANAQASDYEGASAEECEAAAAAERELAGERNTTLVPEPLGISLPTLGKFAEEAGIELQRGRRKAA